MGSFMRCVYLLGLSFILIVGLFSLTCQANGGGGGDDDTTATSTNTQTARARFTLPRLFDFDRYKTAFNKQYTSLTENAARARLFLGRAFRAFISAISYKQRKSSSYLAINQMSDWTPEEVRKIDLRPEQMAQMFARHEEDTEPMDTNVEKSANEDEPVPVASLDEVESALSELAAREEPAMRLLAGERERSRRDVALARERQISLDDIAREPVAVEGTAGGETGSRVESNNPEYEPPELVSFGWSDGLPLEPLSRQASDILTSSPGANFLSWVLRGAFGGGGANSGDEEEKKKKKADDVEPVAGELAPVDELFFDHRDECMFAPRNQGRCGSCYAFATVTIYEWLYCKATGKKVAFSEQYIVDCGAEFGMDGCDGGYTHKVPDFVRKYGLEMRANYPYRERADRCPYDRSTPNHARGYLRVSTRWVKRIDMSNWERELANNPMVISLYVSDAFHEYGGGVHDGADCDQNRGHAVVLVGSGREDGQEYWLFRNSYSPVYGEAGYYKMSKKAKHCVCNQEAYLFTGFSGFENERGINAKYQSSPLKRRYHEYVTKDLDKL